MARRRGSPGAAGARPRQSPPSDWSTPGSCTGELGDGPPPSARGARASTPPRPGAFPSSRTRPPSRSVSQARQRARSRRRPSRVAVRRSNARSTRLDAVAVRRHDQLAARLVGRRPGMPPRSGAGTRALRRAPGRRRSCRRRRRSGARRSRTRAGLAHESGPETIRARSPTRRASALEERLGPKKDAATSTATPSTSRGTSSDVAARRSGEEPTSAPGS